jgi:hypothetical protein
MGRGPAKQLSQTGQCAANVIDSGGHRNAQGGGDFVVTEPLRLQPHALLLQFGQM